MNLDNAYPAPVRPPIGAPGPVSSQRPGEQGPTEAVAGDDIRNPLTHLTEPGDLPDFSDPMALFNTLEGLESTVERLAAFPLAGEVLASYLIRKAVEAPNVPEWIREPYRQIGEEEEGHGDYPIELLIQLATTPKAQARLRRGVAMGISLRDHYFRELDEMAFGGRRW